MIKTFKEAIENLFKNEIIKDYSLEKIKKATKLLWNPENDFKIIHVAWTNWKGSVSKMVFSVLKEAWKKVWVFTSPHLIDIRERFETDSGLITESDFVEILNRILDLKIDLSYFDKCVLIALLYFQKSKCEYVVLEVGFWWLLDTTNIVTPTITTITSIWYDHEDFLWNTLEEISYQKAWIIKPWIPVVLNHHNEVIENIALEKNASVIFTDKRIKTNLIWNHQEQNAVLAFEICKYLWISEPIILEWLQKVKHLWRLQFLSDNLLIDWAHNRESLISLKEYIDDNLAEKFDNIYHCIWLKKWKDINLIYNIFWKTQNYIWVDFNSEMLEDLSKIGNIELIKVENIKKLSQKNKNNLYVVFGSLYMVGEFLKQETPFFN